MKYILILIAIFTVVLIKLFIGTFDEIRVYEIPEVKNMPDRIVPLDFPQEPVNGWEGKG